MRLTQKKKIRFLKAAVLLSAAALIVFTIATIIVQREVSDTLISEFFAAFRAEAVCTTAIKGIEFLERKREKKNNNEY